MVIKSKAGGLRPGSGRPKGSGRYREATRPIRVPNSLVEEVEGLLLRYQNNNQNNNKNEVSIKRDQKRDQMNMNMKRDQVQGNQINGDWLSDIYHPALKQKIHSFPFYATRVAAGFPSPADDYLESKLDLNQYLVKHPAATFFVRVEGESMLGAGIHPDDILVVDRSLKPTDGKIVIAVVNGELTVKRLKIGPNSVTLLPENPRYPAIPITEEMNFSIWGVVTNVIHSL